MPCLFHLFLLIYQTNSKFASVFKSSELVVKQYVNLEILTGRSEKANSGKENLFSNGGITIIIIIKKSRLNALFSKTESEKCYTHPVLCNTLMM